MKAILSYGKYFSCGKDYQIHFIYDNELEAQNISTILKKFKENKLITPYYTKYISKNNQKTFTVINKTNVPKEILLPFISMLITINKINLTIGGIIFNTFNIEKISQAIDNLHINGILNKGNFFSLEDTYYISFRYSSEKQKDELLYYFNFNTNNNIHPIIIDKLGNITSKNNGTVVCTNIPTENLNNIIKEFIEKYNMVIIIGNIKLKDKYNEEELNTALNTLTNESNIKKRTKVKQDAK